MFNNKQFLIAEVGLAHDGSLDIAKSFAKIAKLNGAYVKKSFFFKTIKRYQ